MKYDKIKHYKDEDFRRLSGIKRSTFEKMIEILKESEERRKPLEVSLIYETWKIGY